MRDKTHAHDYILLGDGGHASAVAATARLLDLPLSGVATNLSIAPINKLGNLGLPLITEEQLLYERSSSSCLLMNGIGKILGCEKRRELFLKFSNYGYIFHSLVHPYSFVDPSAVFGQGTQIMAGAVVQNDVEIGADVIINTRASIDHGTWIGDHTHIAPGAIICGEVEVGANCFIGAGAIVKQGTKIASGAVIKAGSLI